jgi:hypothetical protein
VRYLLLALAIYAPVCACAAPLVTRATRAVNPNPYLGAAHPDYPGCSSADECWADAVSVVRPETCAECRTDAECASLCGF